MPNVGGGVYVGPAALSIKAKTPAAGTALVNGTPNVITWNVPNDGALHTFEISATLNVTGALTGGQIVASFTSAGSPQTITIFAGGEGVGVFFGPNGVVQAFGADPGTVVSIAQGSAATAGAAQLLATIFGQ